MSLYHLIRPASRGPAPHPAIVMLHGIGSNEQDLFQVAAQVDPRISVLSVRAPYQYQWGGYMWYDVDAGPGLANPLVKSSLDQLTEFIDELPERYQLDPRRLFVGGFSQGAAMAGALGLLQPQKVSGVIMLSGYLPPPDRPGRYDRAAAGKPYFQANGTLDEIVRIEWGRETRDALLAVGVNLTYREYAMAHEVILPELLDLGQWLETEVIGSAGDSAARE